MSRGATATVVEVGMDEIEAILERTKEGPLAEGEREMIRALAESYLALLLEIKGNKATIARLRRLVFGAKTETKENVTGKAPPTDPEKKPGAETEKGTSGAGSADTQEGAAGTKKPPKRRKGHGRIPAEAYTGAARVKLPHETLAPGDPCPCCEGKVYRKKPRLSVRIRGSSPFVATVYEQDFLRCGLCGETFTAALPPELGKGEKFDETVASMAALLRYGSGLPMNRIEGLSKVTGVPFPASTQWELLRDAAEKIQAVHLELIRQAAQGRILMNDDTPMKILDHIAQQKLWREGIEKPPKRTGTFTSGILSVMPDQRQIVLYFTGKQHAGENLAKVMAHRAEDLPPPIQMCDGLGHNAPAGMETILANCLVHARRQFVDVASGFPAEVEYVIEEFSKVYQIDARAKSQALSADERLRLHQEESAPVMKGLKTWMRDLLEGKKVEPNSGLGKAIAYCQKRWEELTLFLREPDAPLDNNATERMLKKAILHRKNSLFYRTENGAAVGDLYMSLIATTKLAGADPFDYLTELQRHAEEVEASPADWMPWNYRETIGRTTGTN